MLETADTIKARLLVMIMGISLFVACTPVADKGLVTSSPVSKPLVWPADPEIPRILYITSIKRPEDMQIRPGLLERFWNYLIGKAAYQLVAPFGVAADDYGKLYVVDSFLRKTMFMDRDDGRSELFPDDDELMQSPVGIAIDERNNRIFVSDSAGGVVRHFAVKGSGKIEQTGELGKGEFERPTGIAVNQVTSELLVVDTGKNTVFRYDPESGRRIGKIGGKGTARGEFNRPTSLCVDRNGRIIVTDALNCRVQIFSSVGQFLESFGSNGDGPGHFARPRGVATDSDNNIYVVDALFDNVQIFDEHGRLLMAFGTAGKEAGQFWLPAGICITPDDTIYVADSFNKRVQVFRYLKQGRLPQ